MALIIVVLGISALRKKKRSSEKLHRRVSTLKKEFNDVKEETNDMGDSWIEMRLNDADPDLDDMILINKK